MSYDEKEVHFHCLGRGHSASEYPLKSPVEAEARLHHSPGSGIFSCNVNCIHNTGGHGDRCKASHPDKDKFGKRIWCPYSFDFPYVLESNQDWQAPEELKVAVEEMIASMSK